MKHPELPPKLSVAFEFITPEMAKEYLANNPVNRDRKASPVTRYSRDMLAGDWCITGQSIQFDEEGQLLDGQHRLYSLSRTGMGQWFVVVRGLPLAARDYIDIGSKRTLADQLKMNGYSNNNALSAMARVVLGVLSQRNQRSTMSEAELRHFIRENQDTLMTAVRHGSLSRHSSMLEFKRTTISAAFWLITQAGNSEATVERWLQDVVMSRTDGVKDPRFVLARRLRSSRGAKERLSATEELGLYIRAWNLTVEGASVASIAVNKTVPKPLVVQL